MKKFLMNCVFAFFLTTSLFAGDLLNSEDNFYEIAFKSELGVVSLLNHTLQIGDSGTEFNYITQGGQDILFPFSRYEIQLKLAEKNHLRFLYQPIEINTRVNFDDPVTMDGVTFSAETAMDITYSFPFWRITYLYDFSPFADLVLAGGAAMQIRNASLVFASADGEDITVSQNTGLVPALSLMLRKEFSSGLSLDFEATGSYASSALFNGASFEFEGSLLDTALTMGWQLKYGVEWLLSVRFIGGSAIGNSEYVDRTWSESQNSYTANKLATLVIATGIKIK